MLGSSDRNQWRGNDINEYPISNECFVKRVLRVVIPYPFGFAQGRLFSLRASADSELKAIFAQNYNTINFRSPIGVGEKFCGDDNIASTRLLRTFST